MSAYEEWCELSSRELNKLDRAPLLGQQDEVVLRLIRVASAAMAELHGEVAEVSQRVYRLEHGLS